MMPSRTIRPIASAHVERVAIALATNALRPRPVASASGKLATAPIRIVSTPATSAVPAAITGRLRPVPGAAAEEGAGRVGHEAEDQRVEHDDVGHRQEGDDAAAHLAADASSPVR